MAAITICSGFGAPKKKVSHSFHCFPIYLPWSDGTGCHDVSFLNVEVLSRLFQSPLLPSSRGSLVPLGFLSLEWYHLHIWGCRCFSRKSWFQLVIHPAWHFTWCTLHDYISKQSDNTQPCLTPFPIWNQSIVPCLVPALASCPAYRFLRRQVRWSGIPIL